MLGLGSLHFTFRDQRINGSTDQRINGSTDQRINGSTYVPNCGISSRFRILVNVNLGRVWRVMGVGGGGEWTSDSKEWGWVSDGEWRIGTALPRPLPPLPPPLSCYCPILLTASPHLPSEMQSQGRCC